MFIFRLLVLIKNTFVWLCCANVELYRGLKSVEFSTFGFEIRRKPGGAKAKDGKCAMKI
jgi:hypothetical protein